MPIPSEEILQVGKEYRHDKAGGVYVIKEFCTINMKNYPDGAVGVIYAFKGSKKNEMGFVKEINEFREKFSDAEESLDKIKKLLKQSLKKDYYIEAVIDTLARNPEVFSQYCQEQTALK